MAHGAAKRMSVAPQGTPDNDDVHGAAVEGLCRAAISFDPERGVKFATYASHCIRGSIMENLRSLDHLSRRYRGKVNAEEYDDPGPPTSLDGARDDYGWDAPDVNGDAAGPVVEADTRRGVRKAVRDLDVPMREVIQAAYWNSESQSDIARRDGVTEGRVSQRKREAYARLRPVLAGLR